MNKSESYFADVSIKVTVDVCANDKHEGSDEFVISFSEEQVLEMILRNGSLEGYGANMEADDSFKDVLRSAIAHYFINNPQLAVGKLDEISKHILPEIID